MSTPFRRRGGTLRHALPRASRVVVCVAAVLGPLAGAAPTDAASCGDYLAVAAADGARGALSSPGYLVVEQSDSAAPSAQARVDSLGNSDAFAGYPYPGATALSALALTPASGAYPLSVASSFPTSPKAASAIGPVQLAATSEERGSSADARGTGSSEAGTTIGVTSASAKAACPATGGVTAAGESDAQGLAFGDGVLQIARVHSVATAVVDEHGNTTLQSHLDVSAATIAGQRVALTDQGFEAIGNGVPAPPDPIAGTLASAGISVTYMGASKDVDGHGVVAPGLVVSITREAVGSGPTVVTYTFGRAYAAARAGSTPAAVAAPAVGPPAPSPPSEVPPPPAPEPARVSAMPQTAGALPAAAALPPQPATTVSATRTGGLNPLLTASSASMYIVLAAAAASVFLGAVLFRIFGVRLKWI